MNNYMLISMKVRIGLYLSLVSDLDLEWISVDVDLYPDSGSEAVTIVCV